MIMRPLLRNFALTAHVTSSIGWIGAVGVFLALAIIGLTSPDDQTVRRAYLVMEPGEHQQGKESHRQSTHLACNRKRHTRCADICSQRNLPGRTGSGADLLYAFRQTLRQMRLSLH